MPKNKQTRILASGIMVVCALSLNAANSPIIGIVSSGQGMAGAQIDGARVSSNATLFDGSEVTSAGYSRVQLNSGTRLDLGTNSVVRVYASHASLEGGASEIQGPMGYAIDARTLRIQPSVAGSVARVRLDGAQKVLVTALSAPVNVWNSNGILVARVMPETPMSFLPQAAASNVFSSSGCVLNKSNSAVLVDQTGNQVFGLHSASVDLRKFVGKRVKVTGTVDASAKATGSQMVNVSAVESASGAGCVDVAAGIGATMTAAGLAASGMASAGAGAATAGAATAGAATAGAATAGAATVGATAGVAGLSASVIGGVVAAVGAAATVGGLAAAGTFSSKPSASN